jgi:hypothetical protein
LAATVFVSFHDLAFVAATAACVMRERTQDLGRPI